MINKTATDKVIRGLYQFDLSIIKMIELKEKNREIAIWGIEDIDLIKQKILVFNANSIQIVNIITPLLQKI